MVRSKKATSAEAETLGPLRALADPTRFRLFLALRQAERCVRDLVASEGIAQPLVSHHLGVLARAGLVQTRWAHGFRLYAVSPEGAADALERLTEVLDLAAVSPIARPGGNEACCK